MQTKLCNDCKHHFTSINAWRNDGVGHECSHAKARYGYSRVDGSHVILFGTDECRRLRMPSADEYEPACGPEGKLWEAKP